jgi:dihydrofolate reductase
MGLVTCQLSVSLDGFVAGPHQSVDNPLGEGGMRLHEWVFGTEAWRRQHGLEGGEDSVDSKIVEDLFTGVGAYIMGRNMFGGGQGDWDESWTGWWGDDPPFHTPVFVLTHHERTPLAMQGGTTFHFVTGGIESALALAHAAAGDSKVSIAGGASCVNQYLAAGLIDELTLHVAPVVLGSGERLFDGVADLPLEQVEVVAGNRVTHLRYRVTR